jgi:hypothetical protein
LKQKIKYTIFSAILAACAIGLLSLNDDPFVYLHQKMLTPFVKPWIAKQNELTVNALSETPISKVTLEVMAAVESGIKSKKLFTTSPAFISDDGSDSGCQLFIIQNINPTQTITTRPLQNTLEGECSHKISGFQFSDDENYLVLELRNKLSDAREIFLYSLSHGQYQLAHKIAGRLVRPNAFTLDNEILLDTPVAGLKTCLIVGWKNTVSECKIGKSDLPADAQGKAVAMFRAKNSNRTWVIISKYLTEIGKVYLYDSDNLKNILIPTGIQDVSRLAITEHGFIYAEAINSDRLNDAPKTQLNVYTPGQKKRTLFVAEETQIDWAEYDSGALVLVRDIHGLENKLLVFNESTNESANELAIESAIEPATKFVIKQIPLSAHLQKEKNITLNLRHHGKRPHIRIENDAGEKRDGWIDEKGDFIELRSHQFPFEIDIQKLYAESQDGARVPCNWITKKGSTVPQASVVRVYGAYGRSLIGEVNEISAAVLENQIGYLLAHVRGGGEQGKAWENAGKAKNKENTVWDTQACIQTAIQRRLIQEGKILLYGSSAGAIPAMLTALRNPTLVAGAWLDSPYLDGSGLHHNRPEDNEEFGDVTKADELKIRKKITPYLQLLTPSKTSGRFLLTCGEQDKNTPTWHCTKTHAAIGRYHPNKQSYLWVSKNTTHFVDNPYSPEQREKNRVVIQFILKTLVNP